MECMTISDIRVPENTSLWSLYFIIDDVAAYDYVWRIYDTSNHNRMLTDDYGELPYCYDEIDRYIVVSAYINHNTKIVKVYVRPGKKVK